MAKVDEPKNKSTLDIYTAMGNEALPDHLLTPDSLEKKKRIALQMREIEYVVFLEKFKIHEALMSWIKNKSADDKVYYEQDFLYRQELKQLFDHWQLLASTNLNAEQLARLDELRKNFDALFTKFESKIEQLSKLVSFHQSELHQLEKELKEIRIQYGREWSEHFSLPANAEKFRTLVLTLAIPENLKSIAASINFDTDFKIDKSIFASLGQQVGLKLSEGNTSESKILSLIKNMTEEMIRKELEKKAMHFPEKERKQLVDQWIKSPEISQVIENLSAGVLKNVSSNSKINQKIVKAQACESDVFEAAQKLNFYNHKLFKVKAVQAKFKEEAFADKKNISVSSFPKHVDTIQSKINAAAEALKKLDEPAMPIQAIAAVKERCIEALKQVDASAAQAKETLSQGKLAEFNLESFLKGMQTIESSFTAALPTIGTLSKPEAEKPQPATPVLR